MNRDRWLYLETNPLGKLTQEEIAEGWHFCYDWDGLLIGPGMREYEEHCTCNLPNRPEAPE